jgi:hypothetical protein
MLLLLELKNLEKTFGVMEKQKLIEKVTDIQQSLVSMDWVMWVCP